MIKLEFTGGGNKAVALDKPRLTVGRDKQNDICLPEAAVSGFHAEFHCDDGKIFLVDLGSSNGTFVNAKSITGRIQLKVWDKVRFASVEAELVDPDGRRPTLAQPVITDAMLAQAAAAGMGSSPGAATQASARTADDNKTQVRAAISSWMLQLASGKSVPVAGSVTLGRDANCDVGLNPDNKMISRQHARIIIQDGKPLFKDLGSANGSYVNGKRVSEQVLKAGDEIKLDTEIIKVLGPAGAENDKTQMRPSIGATATQTQATLSGSGTRAVPVISASLKVTKGLAGNKEFTLSKSAYSIGRVASNDIVLEADSVSSKHAKLIQKAGGWVIKDEASTNGTWINGKRISEQALVDGDQLRVGEVHIGFSDGASARTASSTRQFATVVTPVARLKSLPAWVYGVSGFALVAVVLGGFLFRDNLLPDSMATPAQITAPLQAGRAWTYNLPTNHAVVATPAIGDINGDGVADIIVADQNGFVTALDGHEGKLIFQAQLAGRFNASPTMADLTGNGQLDVIVASDSGVVTALNSRGQALWRSPPELNMGEIVNKPALADVNGDRVMDIIVPTRDRGLVALDGSRGWEIWNTAEMTRGAVTNYPRAQDINGDGVTDFISVTDSGQVLALSAQGGSVWQLWEATLPAISYATPVVASVSGAQLVIVATDNAGLFALDGSTGRQVWNALAGQEFFSSPVVADVSGDGVANVIITARNGNTFVLDARFGEEYASGALPGEFPASPALYDVTQDRLPELFMLDGRGTLHVLNANRVRPEMSVSISGSTGFVASPVLADVTGDGLLNVVSASQDGSISAYTLNRTTRRNAVVWSEFLGTPQR